MVNSSKNPNTLGLPKKFWPSNALGRASKSENFQRFCQFFLKISNFHVIYPKWETVIFRLYNQFSILKIGACLVTTTMSFELGRPNFHG